MPIIFRNSENCQKSKIRRNLVARILGAGISAN